MPKAKPRFIPYNIDQNAMVVINYQDQLQPGTFEHAKKPGQIYFSESQCVEQAANGVVEATIIC